MKMTKKTAKQITGGLSNPSKMPCKGYSIPAAACKTGSKLRKKAGTVCSDCYACKGMYHFPVVQAALQRRLDSLVDPDWTEAMVALIGNDEYFRWHDSGDIQSEMHLLKIVAVCDMTPATRHWLPTKEASLVKRFAKKWGLPDNLTIRLSAPLIDNDKLPVDKNESIVSSRSMTAEGSKRAESEGSYICPAPQQDNECRDCRACWSMTTADVVYKMH